MENQNPKALIPLPDHYGVVTIISKELNSILGDKSGRSISMRTSHGFKNSLKLRNIHDNDVELIVHVGILAMATLLTQKRERAKGFGAALLLGLILCYWKGKDNLLQAELTFPDSSLPDSDIIS